jgi:hypothetical protein
VLRIDKSRLQIAHAEAYFIAGIIIFIVVVLSNLIGRLFVKVLVVCKRKNDFKKI